MPFALLLPIPPLITLCTFGFFYLVPHYQTPEQIPYWTLLFGLPHILASFQTACDAEYLRSYKKLILLVLFISFLPFVLYQTGVSSIIIFTIYFILTVYHVIAQQFGIAMSVARLRPTFVSTACKWTTLALGIAAYLQSYFAPDLNGNEYYTMLTVTASAVTTPLLVLITIASGFLVWQARANTGAAMLLALNIMLLIVALILIFKTPYLLLGLMLVRILHDTTGFVVYIKHDVIRNQDARKNLLYKLFPYLPVWLLNPAIAITIAALLSYFAGYFELVLWLVIGNTIAHYYTESFVWRHGTPHRQHFSLSAAAVSSYK